MLTSTDASGQKPVTTYTATGQIATVTTPPTASNPQGVTTTYGYNSNDQITTITGPGGVTTYEYDGYGRMWKVTDPEGYAVTTEYDALDRPTKTRYPDGTHEETVYDKLDAAKRRDRTGRWTETFYDALRRPVSTRDAETRRFEPISMVIWRSVLRRTVTHGVLTMHVSSWMPPESVMTAAASRCKASMSR